MRRVSTGLAALFLLLLAGGEGLTEPATARFSGEGTYITLIGPQVMVPRNLPEVAIAGDGQRTRDIPLRGPNSRRDPGGQPVTPENPTASEQQRKRALPLPVPDSMPSPTSQAPEANAVDSAAETGLQLAAPADILVSFDGLDSADNPVPGTPPDPQVAVGPGHIVEFVNNVGRISDKGGMAVEPDFTLASFFLVPAANNDFDPKIIYDDIHDRFFASYVSVSPAGDGLLHFAVSQTDDPTGVWNVYSSPPYVGQIPDYPGIGVTSDKFTVSSNVFLSSDDTFLGEQTVVIEKADVMAGGGSPNAFAFAIDHTQFTVRPAHHLTAGADQFLTTFSAEFSCCVNINKITLIKITGTPDGGNVAEASSTHLPIITQMSPFDAPTDGPGTIKSGDQRMLEAIWRSDSLWSSAGARCRPAGDAADRSCAHLIEVETAGTPSVVQDIMYGAPGEYFVFPAIRTDSSGNLYVSMTGTHGGVFAGAKVAGRLATDPPGTMSGTCLLKAGETVHDTIPARWGDYMGAAVDPADPSKVWVVGQYAKADGVAKWGTYIGSMSFGATGVCPAQPAPPAPTIYEVDTTSNSSALTGCDTLTPDDCSLPGAVANANASAPADVISFDIPNTDPGFDGTLYTIEVDDSPLELTSHGTEIDATTQPGYSGEPIVRLRAHNAAAAPVDRAAIGIFSSGNTVRGLLINASVGESLSWGIYVQGVGGNQIAGNWFGLNAAGSAAQDRPFDPVILYLAGPGNLIGGKGAGDGNVISAGSDPILILGGGENLVHGNIIGPEKTGTIDIGSFGSVYLEQTRWNLIGGTEASARNVISAQDYGVFLAGGATDNVVQGNYIGVDATGNASLPNFVQGVTLRPGASFNLIGGPETSARNIISRNGQASIPSPANVWVAGDDNAIQGNWIGPDVGCVIPPGPPPSALSRGVVLAGDRNEVTGNVISGHHTGVGIGRDWLVASVIGDDNALQGNIVGMNCSGNATLSNSTWGIAIEGGSGNTIGGSLAEEGNLIAGSGNDDIILDPAGIPVVGNVFKGNIINLDASGSVVIGSFRRIGVLDSAHDNTFGGMGGGEGNLIGCQGSFEPVTVNGAGSVGNLFRGNTYRCTSFGPGFFGGFPVNLVSGGNAELAAPVLTNDHPPRGTTCPSCQVEIVSHRGTSGAAVNSVVEGWTTADGSGNFELAVAPVGPRIFAAATNAAGNTSEFSAGLLVDFDNDTIPDSSDTEDDGDGFTDTDEGSIGTGSLDPCGNDGWPADLQANNRLDIGDMNSFLFPLRDLNGNTIPGEPGPPPGGDDNGEGVFNKFNHPVPDVNDGNIERWNLLVDGTINIGDLNALNPAVIAPTSRPPMFGGQPAFFTDVGNGVGGCPYPP